MAKCCARIALALRRATHERHLHRCPLFPWTIFLSHPPAPYQRFDVSVYRRACVTWRCFPATVSPTGARVLPSDGVHGRARQSPARELRGGGHVAHLSSVGAQDRRGRLTIEGSRSVNNIIRGRERRIVQSRCSSSRFLRSQRSPEVSQ